MSIRSKFLFAFTSLCLLTALAGGIALLTYKYIGAASRQVSESSIGKARAADDLMTSLVQKQVWMLSVAATGPSPQSPTLEQMSKSIERSLRNSRRMVEKGIQLSKRNGYAPGVLEETEELERVTKIEGLYRDYNVQLKAYEQCLAGADLVAGKRMRDEVLLPSLERMMPLVQEFMVDSMREVQEEHIEINKRMQMGMLYIQATVVVTVLLALLLSYGISRTILSPLRLLEKAALGIRSGHLDSRVDYSSNNELGTLARTFNDMAVELEAKASLEQESREAILASEEHLSITLDSISDAVLTTDTEGRITRLNPSAEALTHWKQAEAIKLPLEDVFHIIDEQTREAIPVADTLKKGTVHKLTNRAVLIARDGTERPVADSCAPIRNRVGEMVGAVLVIQDMTRRRQAELALRESETRLRELNDNLERLVHERTVKLHESEERVRLAAEAAGVGVWDWEIGNGKVSWDERMFEMYGLPSTSNGVVEYADWRAAVLPGDIEETEGRLQHAATHGGRSQREFRIVRATDHTERVIQAAEMGIMGSDGQVARVVGVNIDITERKQTEAVLHMLSTDAVGLSDEAFLQLVVRRLAETLGVEFVSIGRLDGELQNHIQTTAMWADGQLAPNMLYSLKDTPCDAVVGKAFCIYPDDVQQQFPLDTMLVDMGIVSYAAIPLFDSSDQKLGLLGVMGRQPLQDLEQVESVLRLVAVRTAAEMERYQAIKKLKRTGRELEQTKVALEVERSELAERVVKRTQELTIARDDANLASQAKSDFLSTMSHELRTPLNGVLGMNELLLTTQLDDQQQQYVAASNTSGRVLMELINDILDLSKIEAGKLELDPRECDLQEFIHDVEQVMSHAVAAKGLTLHCRISPEASLVGLCDDNRLRQVLVNLIGNAIKFTSSGSITITLDRVAEGDGTARLRFAISDTGVGIPSERLERLFKAFSQVDSSTTRQYGGTGLGLSISRQLIELMGGEIGVDSQVGVGTTFWFELDLVTSDRPAAVLSALCEPESDKEHHVTPARQQKERLTGHILLAEDNRINQLYIVELLKHFGCTSDVVVNGEEALVAVQQHPYDLVLMDCQMPEMDGFTATREIRKREQSGELTDRIPIIALTANALKGDRERCLETGMDDYLTKPMELDTLRDALSHWVPHRKDIPA